LRNELGQLVYKTTVNQSAVQETRLDLSTFRAGTYFVQFKVEGQPMIVKKMIVTH
jgi:hypothetical protein